MTANNQRRILVVLVCHIAILTTPAINLSIAVEVYPTTTAGSTTSASAELSAERDILCGPRSVQYVLSHFGKSADLVELTREIQYPNLESGARLQDMEESLQSRGIHTFPMDLASNARLCWPHPVIVHMRPRGKSDIGHYVVWLPQSGPSAASLWCGLDGVRRISERDLAIQRSGTVLLTNDADIGDPSAAVVDTNAFSWIRYIIVTTVVSVIVCIGIQVWIRKLKTT